MHGLDNYEGVPDAITEGFVLTSPNWEPFCRVEVPPSVTRALCMCGWPLAVAAVAGGRREVALPASLANVTHAGVSALVEYMARTHRRMPSPSRPTAMMPPTVDKTGILAVLHRRGMPVLADMLTAADYFGVEVVVRDACAVIARHLRFMTPADRAAFAAAMGSDTPTAAAVGCQSNLADDQ